MRIWLVSDYQFSMGSKVRVLTAREYIGEGETAMRQLYVLTADGPVPADEN